MAKTEKRPLSRMGADTSFRQPTKEGAQEPLTHRETGEPSHGETGQEPNVVKTSFYPTQDQLDKLDDLASE
jgi:hypothetical protein